MILSGNCRCFMLQCRLDENNGSSAWGIRSLIAHSAVWPGHSLRLTAPTSFSLPRPSEKGYNYELPYQNSAVRSTIRRYIVTILNLISIAYTLLLLKKEIDSRSVKRYPFLFGPHYIYQNCRSYWERKREVKI